MNSVAIRWGAFVVMSMALSACGSGSSSGSSSTPPVPPVAPAAPELSGLAPTSINVELQTGQSTSVEISFSNTGDAALTFELTSQASFVTIPTSSAGTLQPATNTSISVDIACGSSDASGTIALRTNDADEAITNIPVATTCAPVPTDLAVARVLLNQGARGFDSNLSGAPTIAFIAGREMLVRAFVTGSGVSPDARVVVTVPGQADAEFVMQIPPSISTTPATDTVLQASHYVVVPGSAVQENASLRIEVAPFSVPITFPSNGSIDLGVEDAGVLRVTFVPVTFESQTPSIDASTYIEQALQVLPVGAVDVEVRTPYTFTGSYDLEDLLTEISDLRNLDGSTRLYHGIVIPPASSSSNSAGIGYVGFPVSVSIDLSGLGFVIAHELGHNLNLGHAPGCDAPDPDASYPYVDAAVGVWGYDITRNELVEPTAAKRDFMSYCNDLWVSDYHFNRAIEHRAQSPIGFGRPVGAGLTISGLVRQGQFDGVHIIPAERLVSRNQTPAGASLRTFVAWDEAGIEVARTDFSMQAIEDASGATGFSFSIAQPVAPIHHFEIQHIGAVLYAHTMDSTTPPPANVSWTATDGNIAVNWQRQDNQALVVKNLAGEIISIDRTGQFSLLNDAAMTDGISISLVQSGHTFSTATVIPRNAERVLLTP